MRMGSTLFAVTGLAISYVVGVQSLAASPPTCHDDFCLRYAERLDIDFSQLNGEASSEKLSLLTEKHLGSIPFENLRLHGASSAPVSMDTSTLEHVLIDRRRGGLCFELNSLFAEFLSRLGYQVMFIPATLLTDEAEEDIPHLTLLVKDAQHQNWLVDVGLGETPLHPLRYAFDRVQKTPEGMVSRLREEGNKKLLEWYLPGKGVWEPRLEFSDHDTNKEWSPADFERFFLDVLEVGSSFRRKPVVCKLTRDEKVTVAGNILKRSKNRFAPNAHIITHELETPDQVRYVLRKEFGIPLGETTGLSIPAFHQEQFLVDYVS